MASTPDSARADYLAEHLGVFPVAWLGDRPVLWASEAYGRIVTIVRNFVDGTIEAVGVAPASDRWRLEAVMDDAEQIEAAVGGRKDPLSLFLLVAHRSQELSEVEPADLAVYVKRQGFEVDVPPRDADLAALKEWVQDRFDLPPRPASL